MVKHRNTLCKLVWACIWGSLTLALGACGGSGAASGTPEERVHARIDSVVKVCRDEDWKAAAGYFAYRGSDRERKYKDTYDGNDDKERYAARRSGCDGLLDAFPERSASYRFADYRVEEESEGAWHVQVLDFPDHPDANPVYVAMLEINNRMVIGDVD